jgi:hypothetical protein
VIAAMAMAAARIAFFFHVSDFATGSNFAIPADDTSAAQRGETQKPNETH